MATKITAKELAALCNTDGKSMRRFIRMLAASPDSLVSACGQGNRYGFDPSEAHAIAEAFEAHAGGKGRRNVPARSVDEIAALVYGEQNEQG